MSDPLLQVQGVSKSFDGLQALGAVNLEVSRGEILGLIGPNGAGKTTLFNCIAGALPPSAGRILLRGRDITRLSAAHRTRLGIGRTFQLGKLFGELNVLDNVIAGLGASSYGSLWRSFLGFYRHPATVARAEALLERFDLVEFRAKEIGELPMGVQRRVETARALATAPTLLLLDEPTAGLAHGEAVEYARMVRRVRDEGTTVILIEHNMPFAMGLAERMYVLANGSIIAEGPPAAIRTNRTVIEAYLGTE